MKKVVAIDFDGVLSYYEGWRGIDDLGQYIPGAIDLCQQLIDAGYEVWIYTTRLNTEVNKGFTVQELRGKVAKFLNDEKFPVEVQIWDLPGKPIADMYIDDRAYRHTTNASWFQDEIDEVLSILGHSTLANVNGTSEGT